MWDLLYGMAIGLAIAVAVLLAARAAHAALDRIDRLPFTNGDRRT